MSITSPRPALSTIKAARRRYAFYCRINRGHVLENKETGALELWRANPASPTGIRWRHTVLTFVARYSYYARIP